MQILQYGSVKYCKIQLYIIDTHIFHSIKVYKVLADIKDINSRLSILYIV